MQQLFEDNKKIFFETNQIEFIDSDHHKGDPINSQFIQLVDIILGTSLKENLKENVKEYYTKEVNFDKLLENGNYFSNTKQLLLKEETGQLSFFN